MNEIRAMELSKSDGPSEYIRPTLRKRLEDRKANLERQLGDVNNCLEKLDKNPQLEEFLTAVEKAHV